MVVLVVVLAGRVEFKLVLLVLVVVLAGGLVVLVVVVFVEIGVVVVPTLFINCPAALVMRAPVGSFLYCQNMTPAYHLSYWKALTHQLPRSMVETVPVLAASA